MTAPPFLLGTALLFWGWQTGLLILAVPLAVGIESSLLFPRRWELSRADWSKISDLCAVILLSIVAYRLFQEKKYVVYMVARYTPIIFFPLILCQRFSVGGRIELSALSLLERKKKKKQRRLPQVDISAAYLIATLLGAGIHNVEAPYYYYGVGFLGCWAVYAGRTKHYSLLIWGILTMLVLGLGYAGQVGIRIAEQKTYNYIMQRIRYNANPLQSTTAIGDIGRQKLSNAIIFRMQPDNRTAFQQQLLREATYNGYRGGRWYSFRSAPQKLEDVAPGSYVLQQNVEPAAWVHIRSKPRKGKGTLKLPDGAVMVENLPGVDVQQNALGTVQFSEGGASWLDYRVSYNRLHPRPSPPTDLDLTVPEAEQEAIITFIDELRVRNLAPEQTMARLKRHFDTHFGYTLRHSGKGQQKTPLANFLLDKKAGHCELFATATVLILRELGIPARYAIGYVATEYSHLERQYIVRQRHGHAWTRVFVDGKWQDFDTTSPNWLDLEEQNQSSLHYLSDFFSFLSYQFARVRDSEDNHLGKVAAVLILILIVLVFNRLRKQKRTLRKKVVEYQQEGEKEQLESAFYVLEKAVAEKGFPRSPNEPLLRWTTRIEQAAPDLLDFRILDQAVLLHYALRFGGIRQENDRKQLQLLVDQLDID